MIFPLALTASLLSIANAHAVILAVQGEANSPEGVGLLVDKAIARNCTNISPCQQDTTIIRNAEITANIVNECGRTELSGNIDIGAATEDQLAGGTVTQVKAGTKMTVTIHQVNADGAGPFACDLEETGNTGIFTHNLTVLDNVPGQNGFSQDKTKDFNITVVMPDAFACSGSSQGNVCTVRCRNNALAGPFGGCFPVQQTDVEKTANTAATIQTTQKFDAINKQIAQNIQDLPAAIDANQKAGSGDAQQGVAAVAALLGNTVVSKEAPTQTPEVVNNPQANNPAGDNGNGAVVGGNSTATTTAAAGASPTPAAGAGGNRGNNGGNRGNNGNANGNGNGAAGNGNAGNRGGNNGAANGAAGNGAAGNGAAGNRGGNNGAANGAAGNGAAGNGNAGNRGGNNGAANGAAGNGAAAGAANGGGNGRANNNNNNAANNKRGVSGGLRWAKRMIYGQTQE